jgi:hypothetical protein
VPGLKQSEVREVQRELRERHDTCKCYLRGRFGWRPIAWLIPQGGVLRTNREDYAMQLAELRERARDQHQSILGYWLVLFCE